MLGGFLSGLGGFARLFAPLTAAVVILATLMASTLLDAGAHRLALNGEMAAQVAAASLATSIRSALYHVQALSNEAVIRGELDAAKTSALGPMAISFRSLLDRNPTYAQVRWIDELGQEHLRLERTANGVVRIADDALQDKKERFYVREALSLPPGATYMSPLDLNVENGEIERPRRPILRVAARVVTTDGDPRGIIIINIEGEQYLDLLARADEIFAGSFWLLNSRGEWLRGPRPEDDFAFMVGHDTSLRTSEPARWKTMRSTPRGSIVERSGMWAWIHLQPQLEGPEEEPYDNRTPWVIVAHLDSDAVAEMRDEVLRPTIGIAALVLSLFGYLAWRLARKREHLAAARHRAEAATRAKSLFLANMSHEIRTPMNAIIGLTHLLLGDQCTPEQGQHLHTIDAAARHLLSLLNNILDMSKIDAGRMSLQEQDFRLDDLLSSVVGMLAQSAAAKGLSVELDPGQAPTWLRGDPTRLRQALVNYTNNAVKFTDRGGIVVRARMIADEGDQVTLRFEVEDSGSGVEPDTLPRLFDAFEQADSSTARRHNGSGLGLAITRSLAELMGGEVGAESVVGRGSNFWFTANLKRGEPSEEASTRSGVRWSPGYRVLLAEDNSVNSAVATAILRDAGLEVVTAVDGNEAIKRSKEQHFDLILLDMQMPELDGPGAARQLRATPEYRDVPLIALTANAFDSDREACFAAGMDDFVTKPIDPELLYKAIARFLPYTAGPSSATEA